MDLERQRELEALVWRVMDGDHPDYMKGVDAFTAIAEQADLANGERVLYCEEHLASGTWGHKHCLAMAWGICREEVAITDRSCRIVSKLLTEIPEEKTNEPNRSTGFGL